MEKEILEIIYQFYPKGVDALDEQYRLTIENRRLKSSLKTAEMNYDKWTSFLDSLKELVKGKYKIEDWTQLFNDDACYTCRFNISTDNDVFIAVSLNVSVISKYYSIYISNVQRLNGKFSMPVIEFDLAKFQDTQLLDKIKKNIELHFYKYSEFPIPLANKIVDGITIGNKSEGEVTFFNCIFTTNFR